MNDTEEGTGVTQPEELGRNLTIGQMAKLNEVSVKTLRLYQERGLIEPAVVNKETGYRYYRAEQSLELDRIGRLQNMGFTLNEIVEFRALEDPLQRMRALQEKLRQVERRLAELTTARNDIKYLLSHGERDTRRHHRLGEVDVMWQSARSILAFDIDPFPFPPKLTQYEVNDWYRRLRWVKQTMLERGIPLALFRDVSIVIDGSELAAGRAVMKQLFVPIESQLAQNYPDHRDIPEGFYLVTYQEMLADEDGSSLEHRSMLRLANHAREQGYRIVGDLLDEGDVLEPFDPHMATNKLIKQQLPIEL